MNLSRLQSVLPRRGVLVALGALVVLFFSSYYSIDEQHRGVLTTMGKYSALENPGPGFKMPFLQSIENVPTNMQVATSEVAVNTYTIDGQEIDATFTVFFSTPPENVEYVYKNIPDVKTKVYQMSADRFKVEVGKVNVSVFSEQRGLLRDRIKAILVEDTKALGAVVSDFQMTNVEYGKSYRASIEASANAKAGIETKEQLQRQEQIVAATAKITATGQADAARETARGKADAALLEAQAEAKGAELKGLAQAAAIEAQAKALASNAQLVEYTKAKQWNGALPTQMLAGALPFFNIGAPGAPPGK
jgi:regulator of protease activity HflC (stomatin/prohibitin superfamily)